MKSYVVNIFVKKCTFLKEKMKEDYSHQYWRLWNYISEKKWKKKPWNKSFQVFYKMCFFFFFFNAWYYNSFFDKFAKIIIIANQFESWYKVCSSRYICQKSTSKWSTSTSSTSYIIIIHISQKSGKLGENNITFCNMLQMYIIFTIVFLVNMFWLFIKVNKCIAE